jgi:hypothetical protein
MRLVHLLRSIAVELNLLGSDFATKNGLYATAPSISPNATATDGHLIDISSGTRSPTRMALPVSIVGWLSGQYYAGNTRLVGWGHVRTSPVHLRA